MVSTARYTALIAVLVFRSNRVEFLVVIEVVRSRRGGVVCPSGIVVRMCQLVEQDDIARRLGSGRGIRPLIRIVIERRITPGTVARRRAVGGRRECIRRIWRRHERSDKDRLSAAIQIGQQVLALRRRIHQRELGDDGIGIEGILAVHADGLRDLDRPVGIRGADEAVLGVRRVMASPSPAAFWLQFEKIIGIAGIGQRRIGGIGDVGVRRRIG